MKNTKGKPFKRFKKNILRLLGFYRKYEKAYVFTDEIKNGYLTMEYIKFKKLLWKGKGKLKIYLK